MHLQNLTLKNLGVCAAVLAIGVAALGLVDRPATRAGSAGFTLAGIEADVTSRWPEVTQLSTVELEARMASGEPPLLLDVREDAEYRVSHLAGAERIDPKINPAAFAALISEKARGRDVVFYCSVGMRSSNLAAEMQDGLIKSGATSVANLKGGIFGWHNERRALVDGRGPTDFVHPYDQKWGTLVARPDQTRMDVTR